jgi:hypothetical protein
MSIFTCQDEQNCHHQVLINVMKNDLGNVASISAIKEVWVGDKLTGI